MHKRSVTGDLIQEKFTDIHRYCTCCLSAKNAKDAKFAGSYRYVFVLLAFVAFSNFNPAEFYTNKAAWMIWQGRPAEQSVARLQALGLKSLVFKPAANTPDRGDFIAIMKRSIMELQKAFQP